MWFTFKSNIFKVPIMTKHALFLCICFMNVNSFWNINSFILQRCFKFIVGLKIFYEFNHIFKHKKSVAKVIYMYYCEISKRLYSLVTSITNFWIRFKTIVKIFVITDFKFFWFPFQFLHNLQFFQNVSLFITHTSTPLNKLVDKIYHLLQKQI